MVEKHHAARLSKLAVSSQRSAALSAARLRMARSETPGWRILRSSPPSFAGRLDLISDGKGNSAVRLEAGLDFQTTFTRGCTTGLFSTVPQKARHCSGMALLIWTVLQHAASPRCNFGLHRGPVFAIGNGQSGIFMFDQCCRPTQETQHAASLPMTSLEVVLVDRYRAVHCRELVAAPSAR